MSTQTMPLFLKIIHQTLEERRKRNPKYSLRAFSRDLGISAAQLSMVLNRHKMLPTEQACKIGLSLKLGPNEFYDFVVSTIQH